MKKSIYPIVNTIEKEVKVIEVMSLIARKSKGMGLDKAMRISEVGRLSNTLDCTVQQALFFSLVVYLSVTESEPRYKDIALHLGHDPFDMMNHVADMRTLQKRGMIRKNRSMQREGITDVNFYVPADVIEALTEETHGRLNDHRITDAASLFARIHRLMALAEEEILIQSELHDEITELLLQYPELPCVKNVSRYRLDEWDLVFLLALGAEVLKGEPVIDLEDLLKAVLVDAAERFRTKKALMRGDHPLIRKGLVALETSFFASDRNIILTDKAMKELFDADYSMATEQIKEDPNIILPGKLRSRKLFFNAAEANQLGAITSSLTASSFQRIRKELQSNNLPSGISILFYGVPGTGKTEAVNQLARRLNKKIFKVDISQTKDLFFGESEKRVKKLFDNYRELVRCEKNCPILLFNEADGVLSKRKDPGASSVSQTENAIQNILLEEMENLEGIMIATTNLTMNLDKAFERRFLYKIQFQQPEPEVRAKIWKEHIPELKPREALLLARAYPYTGGQVSNIARKVISSRIIAQNAPDLTAIKTFCDEEQIRESRRVGY